MRERFYLSTVVCAKLLLARFTLFRKTGLTQLWRCAVSESLVVGVVCFSACLGQVTVQGGNVVVDAGTGESRDAGTAESRDAGTGYSFDAGTSDGFDAGNGTGGGDQDAGYGDPNRVWAFLFAGQSNMEGNVNGAVAAQLLKALSSGTPSTQKDQMVQSLTDWYLKDNMGYASYGYSPAIVSREVELLAQISRAGVVGQYLMQPRADVLYSNNGSIPAPLNLKAGDGFGPELAAGRMAGETLAGPVAIAKVAYGGTNLYENWLSPSAASERKRETGPLYLKLAEQIKNLSSDPARIHPSCTSLNCRWEAFVWFQGESDSFSSANGAEYEKNLGHLIADVRKATGNPNLLVVIVQIGVWAKDQGGATDGGVAGGLAVYRAQARVVAADARAKLVQTDDLSGFFHYDPAAQWIIGTRIGVALGQQCPLGPCPAVMP
jgi:hypothetical protein